MASLMRMPRRADYSNLARWGGSLLLLASLAFIAERLWRLDWSALTPYFSWVVLASAVAAALLFALSDCALAKAWASLADPGRTLSSRQTGRIYGQGVLMKYLPGSVFQYIGRQIEGAEVGLTHSRIARSSAAEIGLHLVASGGVAVACLLLAASPAGAVAASVAAAIVVAGSLVARHPLATAMSMQVIAFAGFALAAALVGWAVLPSGSDLAHFAALFLLSWLAGFVVPVAPGGLGVREAALLALAGGMLPEAGLLAAVLILRIASIGGDFAYGIGTLLWGRIRNP